MKLPDKIRLYVGKRDIDRANISDGLGECPIQFALERKFPKENVSVGYTIASIKKTYYDICDVGLRFITRFDSGRRVKPTRVVLYKERC